MKYMRLKNKKKILNEKTQYIEQMIINMTFNNIKK